MAGIKGFEELVAWQKARILTQAVYRATQRGNLAKDFGLNRQMQRAAVSVMSNVAEGFERRSPNEFRRFLSIALGSCAELRSQLVVALDVGYLSSDQFNTLTATTKEVSRIISGLRRSIHSDPSTKTHPSTGD